MATITIKDPADNNVALPGTIRGEYNLSAIVIDPPPPCDPAGPAAVPKIRVTLHDESDDSKNWIQVAAVLADVINPLRGTWMTPRPADVQSGHTYTIVAAIIGANAADSKYGITHA